MSKHIVIDARNQRSSTGRYTARLIDHLQAIDTANRYTILVEQKDEWQPSSDNFQRVDADYQQFSFNPLDQIKFAWLLYRLKPGLVHFTMTQQPLLYFGKIVTTTHDLTMLRYTRPSRFHPIIHKIGSLLYRFLFWWSHKKSNRIIVPTRFVEQDVVSLHPFTKERLVVTYEATEPPLPVETKPLDGVNKPFIMHVGAPFPHKNIKRLLEAFELLKNNHSRLQLVLPGKIKGEFKKDFSGWLNQNSQKYSVIVPGFVTDEELKWLYENAEAYVLPSLSEGFGLPGLEAMAHSCPLVSSNATCLPEVYGAAAHYFDPSNTAEMAEKIDEVISDKQLQATLIKRGHKQLEKYSWRRMAEETLDVYRSVLQK